jgi:hypothetical protein
MARLSAVDARPQWGEQGPFFSNDSICSGEWPFEPLSCAHAGYCRLRALGYLATSALPSMQVESAVLEASAVTVALR